MAIDREAARRWSKDRITEELADLRRLLSEIHDDIDESRREEDELEEEVREKQAAGDIWYKREKTFDAMSDYRERMYNSTADIEMDIEFLKSLLDDGEGKKAEAKTLPSASQKPSQTPTYEYRTTKPVPRGRPGAGDTGDYIYRTPLKHVGVPRFVKVAFWLIVLAVAILAVVQNYGNITKNRMFKKIWPGQTTQPSTSVTSPTFRGRRSVGKPPQSAISKHRNAYSRKKAVDPQIEASLETWVHQHLRLKMRWLSFREGEGIWSRGYLDIRDYARSGVEMWVIGAEGGYGFVFHSPDRGKSWRIQWEERRERRNRFSGSYPFIVFFVGRLEGWVGTKNGLLYTRNGGRNWEVRDLPRDGSYVYEYWFFQDRRIRARYAYGGTYESFDGGRKWQASARGSRTRG